MSQVGSKPTDLQPARSERSATLSELSRRRLLQGALGVAASAPLLSPGLGARTGSARSREEPRPSPDTRHVAVVGAGAFGGWTALALLRAGARVTLLDAWGAGNSRSSSGGETRVIRGMYGPDRVYTECVVRSFELWRDLERSWGSRLLVSTGALWMFQGDDAYARSSLPSLRDAGLPTHELDRSEAGRRFPQIALEGIRSLFFEEEAGYLLARRSCQAVAEIVAREGGEVRLAAAEPGEVVEGGMRSLRLQDGTTLEADSFVFACGPWLAGLFPESMGSRVRPTRQDVYFFGAPPGDPRFGEGRMPVWVDFGERIFYGIPGNERRGFKVADDTRGTAFDPSHGQRTPDPEGLNRARGFLARRFPDLAGAPLVESRVCQYENSPDGDLLADRLPGADNVWVAGGGSGHGFKLAPAFGEHMARLVFGVSDPHPRFRLDRFESPDEAPAGTQFDHADGP